jgi:hypothetical protein
MVVSVRISERTLTQPALALSWNFDHDLHDSP